MRDEGTGHWQLLVGSASTPGQKRWGQGRERQRKSSQLGQARGQRKHTHSSYSKDQEKERNQGSQAGKRAKRRGWTEPEWELRPWRGRNSREKKGTQPEMEKEHQQRGPGTMDRHSHPRGGTDRVKEGTGGMAAQAPARSRLRTHR